MSSAARYIRILICSLLVVAAACTGLRPLAPLDRNYLFLPHEIDPNPFQGYEHKKAWGNLDYILFSKRDQAGFRALYGTILTSPGRKDVNFLSIIRVLPSEDQAGSVYDSMVPEARPSEFGKEVQIPRAVYDADQVYLYVADTGYFHIVIEAGRIVYSILVDGAIVHEAQVRKNLQRKLDFIRKNEKLLK